MKEKLKMRLGYLAVLLLLPACNLLGLVGSEPGSEASAPVDIADSGTENRDYFIGREVKDDQSCMVAGIVEKKQIVSSALLHSETIQFTVVEDGYESDVVLALDQDFSVYRFHSQLKSYLNEISVPAGAIARISIDISSTRATVQGERTEIYLPGRKIELEFQPPLPAGTAIPALCLAERLTVSEGGVSLSPALFQFRSLGSSLAGVVGLSVEGSQTEE